jgi:hypothetical protein
MGHLSPVAAAHPAGAHLLVIFWKLSRVRTSGFNGPEPLQPGTIRDWCALMHEALTIDEIEIILAMDASYLAACRREAKPASDDPDQPGE